MLDLSVVVPTYNRLETLRRVLPSLLDQDIGEDAFEVLVCDSQSTDGTLEFVAELSTDHRGLRYIRGRYNGRAMARNAGVREARGEIVLFNDSDILASGDLLRRHRARHRARPHIAVVGLEVQVRSYDDYLRKREHPELRGSLHPPSRKRLSWLYFLTGNASVRRDDLRNVGAFDEGFTGYGHEDLELGYRLAKAGVEILYEPLAVNYHWQDVPHDDQREKMRLAGHSAVRFYRKHPDPQVMLLLGMTPLSRGIHALLTKMPPVLGYIDARCSDSAFARSVIEQYYYVSGINEALAAR
ncbi:MAG: glycosyltransferase family 2 protein [Candidatus Tyrphobacter sp.]